MSPTPVRVAYGLLGCCFVALGVAGYILPVMPGTIFMILALWAFKRSSTRLEAWLLSRPVVGPVLRDWDANHWLTLRTKVLAISLSWIAIVGSILSVQRSQGPIWVIGGLLGMALWLTWYLASRRTKPVRA